MSKVEVSEHEHLCNGYVGRNVPTFARFTYLQSFTNGDGQSVGAGSGLGTPNYTKQVAVTYADGIAQIAAFEDDNSLDSTIIDPSGQILSYGILTLHNSRGAYLETVYAGITIPDSVTPTTWDELDRNSHAIRIPYRAEYYNRDQIDQKLNSLQTAPLANSLIKGRVRLRTAPDSLLDPIAVGDNDTRLVDNLANYNGDLAEAITALASTPTILTINNEVQPVTTDIPANITLDFQNNGKFSISSGRTVTIRSMKDAGNRQIFELEDDTAVVRFGENAVEELNLAWWTGADSSIPSTADVTTALEQMRLSLIFSKGGTIYIPSGAWTTNGGHTLADTMKVRGNGAFPNSSLYGTTLKMSASSPNLFIFAIGEGEYNVQFEDILIDGNSVAGVTGILCEGDGAGASAQIGLRNTTIQSCSNGFYHHSLGGSWQLAQVSFYNCIFINNFRAFRANSLNGQYNFYTTNFDVSDGTNYALYLEGSGICNLHGSEFAGATGGGSAEILCYVSAAHVNLNFYGCQEEGFEYFLYNEASDITGLITLSDCLIQDKIHLEQTCTMEVRNCNLTSHCFTDGVSGNSRVSVYGGNITPYDSDGTPVIPANCNAFTHGSEIIVNLNTTNYDLEFRAPTAFKSTAIGDGNPTVPMVAAGHYTTTSESKRLIQWGRLTSAYVFDFLYSLTRNFLTGRARFSANQQGSKGYDFDADVRVNGLTVGVLQVESNTVVAASGITSNGNARCVITSAILAGSPITITIPVTTALTTATLIAEQFEKYIAGNSTVVEKYHVSRSGVILYLTTVVPAANDSSLNFTIENSTSAGITNSLSSTNVVAGSAGTKITNIIKGSVVLDPANITATTFSTQTFTLTGAVVADSVTLNPPTAGLTSGIIIAAVWISAADTVSISFYNQTAGAINLASATWFYCLIRS